MLAFKYLWGVQSNRVGLADPNPTTTHSQAPKNIELHVLMDCGLKEQ